jgi:mono/diheme cytochrome c family protein
MRSSLPFILGLATMAATLQHCAAKQEVPDTFPADASADLRGDFTEQFHRGEKLYAMSCGGCHNKKVDGRTVIPDFSAPQLLDYEMRTQYPAHGERLHEAKVSKEELDDIQVFLLHRKPSGYPISPPPVPGPPPKMN